MKKRLVICDRDKQYRQMMQSYLIKRLEDFDIMTFGDLSQAEKESSKQIFSILLVSESLYEKELQGIRALRIFILREDGAEAITEYPYLEKYQSMERLIGSMMTEEGGDSEDLPLKRRTASGIRIHAFYSPVRREEQCKAAVAFGQILAKTGRKVLYLNLHAFAGWEELLQKSFVSDITDLLYFMRKGEKNPARRLVSMRQSLGNMDYLAPAFDYRDVLQVSEEEWLAFLTMLEEVGEYSDIIFDMSEICQGLYRMLERSEAVYTMSAATNTQEASVKQYRLLLEKRELTDILDKTKWLAPPQEGLERELPLERLFASPLGTYMKNWTGESGNGAL